jgi:hypothetical protein
VEQKGFEPRPDDLPLCDSLEKDQRFRQARDSERLRQKEKIFTRSPTGMATLFQQTWHEQVFHHLFLTVLVGTSAIEGALLKAVITAVEVRNENWGYARSSKAAPDTAVALPVLVSGAAAGAQARTSIDAFFYASRHQSFVSTEQIVHVD